MGTKNFYYICDRVFSPIPRILNDKYIKSHHFRETGFKDGHVVLNDESVLIIFEPVKIGEIYYSVYKVWKRYVEVRFPPSRIIVAGFINHQSHNYIDLLNLPEDFQTFTSNALPVSVDWDIPVECLDLLEKMRSFFEGHGKDSLISQLNKIQQSLNVAYVTAMEGEDDDFQEIRDSLLTPYFIPEWEELRRRWDYYSSFFEYLPFMPVMKSIGKAVNEISVFFSTDHINRDAFLDQHFDDNIRHVIQKLLEIDKDYIRPEIYNEK